MRIARAWLLGCRLFLPAMVTQSLCFGANVTTYHDDNFRTGWYWQEATLTPALLKAGLFAQLSTATLDEQVDAQPLVLTNQTINGVIYSTVVYVATENNSVYAINATTGAILAQTHLETAAPMSDIFSGSCGNNSVVIGINSTPVIDPSVGTLYVVTTTISGSGLPGFYLHALDAGTLKDKATPLAITNPSATSYNRQRAALTLFKGGVVIPFTSYCDKLPSLGFITYANINAASQVAFQTSPSKLASIWMSGGGPAVSGNSIYFSTGNGQGPYPPVGPPNTNLPESLVALVGSTGTPLSLSFSTLFANPNASSLDANDLDFGSGGVLIIPAGAPASIVDGTTQPQFVTAVGKDGNLFVNNMSLGPSYVQELNVGACDCVYSYYTGSDGAGHVATWAGSNMSIYSLSASGLTLTQSAGASYVNGFPVFSSNGTTAGTAVLWATFVTPTGQVNLNAFDPTVIPTPLFLYGANAGSWPNIANANGNVVPVVANGYVFVASYKELAIFGQPHVVTDAATFTAVTGANGYIGAKGQNYNPATLTGGQTVTEFVDLPSSGHSVLSISGFSSNPGQGWLASAAANGNAKAGSRATEFVYSASTHAAVWGWPTAFGFPSSGTVTTVMVHQD